MVKASGELALNVFALCGLSPAPSLAQASAPVEQMERLMQLQQALQLQHAQQINHLQQQLQAQAQSHAAQDWQWVMAFAALLLGLAALAWLQARWPAWHARHRAWWQADRAARISSSADFSQSHLGQGQRIDPSEMTRPGMLKRILKRRAKGGSPSGMDTRTDSHWPKKDVAAQDDDSQLLADEALREFELRRTVGLLPEAEPEPLDSKKSGRNSHAEHSQVEADWAAMQEVPLTSQASVAAAEPVAAPTLQDVSAEVQRVRKSLHRRRIQRDQHSSVPVEVTEALGDTAPACAIALTASTPAPPMDLIAPSEQVADDVAPTPAFCAVNAPIELNFPASQRGLSEGEVRLALAQEFRRMGQIEEAALLCEEVLRQGGESEQRSARLLLGSLPGH